MAFGNIGLQEPSTITKRVASVTIDRGSTTEHQEVLVLGDVSSSNAIARVLGATPASTEFGLAVRVVEQPSTTVQVSSLAGAVIVRSSAANALFTAYQSSAADLNVTVAGYSTTANVSSVAGKVQVVNSSAADLNVTVAGYSTTANVSSVAGKVQVVNSSAADLNVTVAGYVAPSTTVAVSSLGGIVAVRPSDTNWASSAGFHFDSSGALNVAGTFSASTTVNVSSVAGVVTVRASDTNWASSAGFHFNSSGELLISPVTITGASTVVTVSTGSVGLAGVYDSSGALRTVGDSVNDAIRVNVVAGAAGGSTIVTISTGSVRVHQSTAADLNVTVAGYSTTANVSSVAGIVAVRPSDTNWASSAGFHFNSSGELQIVGTFSASTVVSVSTGSVRVHQSSAADLNVTVAGYSTTANISSVAGKVAVVNSSAADFNVTVAGYSTVVSVSTGSVRVHQSSAADLNVTVAGYSTTVNISSLAGAVIVRSSAADHLVTVYQSTASALLMTATIGTNLQSTAAPSSNSSGLTVRQVVDAIATFASTSALASTTVAVTSTAANIRAYVTAYSITSTNQTPAHWGFFSSNATLLWPITLAALSSGVAGANLAVSAPGYLFRTNASEALNFKTAGSTVSGVQLGVSYFLAP